MKRLAGGVLLLLVLSGSCSLRSIEDGLLVRWNGGEPLLTVSSSGVDVEDEVGASTLNIDVLLDLIDGDLARWSDGPTSVMMAEAAGVSGLTLTLEREDQLAAAAATAPYAARTGIGMAVVSVDHSSGALRTLASRGDTTALEQLMEVGRPTGSAMKTLGLIAALEAGIDPGDSYVAYRCFPGENGFGACGPGTDESETLREAFVKSYNAVFLQVATDVGQAALADLAVRLGISVNTEDPLVVLGVDAQSPLDVAMLYAMIANRGVAHPIHFVQSVDGQTRSAAEEVHVVEEGVAMLTTDMLKEVVARGTGTSAGLETIDVAGKTGTSLRLTDSWFAGFSESRTTVVWIGVEDPDADALRPPLLPQVVGGGSWPADIWREFSTTIDEP